MPTKHPDADDRDLFARVMNAWLKDGQDNAAARGSLSSTLETFTIRHNTLSLLNKPHDVDLLDSDAWIVGRPIEPHQPVIFPVASAAMKTEKDRTVATVRVALIYEGTERLVDAQGWRFETAENRDIDPHAGGKPKPHTYPHAQPCGAWRPRHLCLIHPDAEPDTTIDGCPDCFAENAVGAPARPQIPSGTRPAFPLRCQTLPGLAVSALASFYGAHVARDILSTDTFLDNCGPDVGADFRTILGEPDPT